MNGSNDDAVIHELAQKFKDFVDECIIQSCLKGIDSGVGHAVELTKEEYDKIYREKVGVYACDFEEYDLLTQK